MLSEHLKELENDELIVRCQCDNKKQRVEYSLSQKGASLLPIIEHLQDWGLTNIKNVLSIQEMVAITMA
jgi:DNA-binding HxlR family transcriptional regulator